MSELGFVTQKDSQFVARVNTKVLGTQYQFVGPLRGQDEQLAYQDLCYIRAAAEGALTRVQGLRDMQTAAKLLRDEAKALARGGRKSHRHMPRASGIIFIQEYHIRSA